MVWRSATYVMEVSYEKIKILVNKFENNETAEVITITMNDEPLEVVDKFKYLGMTLRKNGKE